MLDPVILSGRNPPRSIAFHEQALAPLVIARSVDHEGTNRHPDLKGFGSSKMAYFWLKSGYPSPDAVHFAFIVESPDAVDAFYKAAMEAGAQDNIPPRARLEYDHGYYAADVLDPDGYSIEVVHKS